MASSGSFNTNGYEGRYLNFSWNVASQSIANNQTTINWTLKGAGEGQAGWYSATNFKVTINGTTVYSSTDIIQLWNGTVVASGQFTIPHNADGNQSFSAYAEAGIYWYAVNCSGSGSWSLPQIPRQANITAAPNFTDIQNPTVTYSNPAGNNVTSLQICIAKPDGTGLGISYRDISKTGTSYTFNLTETERNSLRQATPNSSTINVTFYIKTVIGGNTFYSSSTKTLTIVNANPTISSITYEDINSTTTNITGNNQLIIRNNSTVQFNLTTLTSLKYATLSNVKITINGVTKTTSLSGTSVSSLNINFGTVNLSSNGNATIVITDSRGLTTTYTKALTMLNWELPNAIITCQRKFNYYSETDINVDANYSSLNNLNTITIQYQYKKTTDSSYSALETLQDNVTTTFTIDNLYAWNVKVIITDLLGSTTYNLFVDKGIPIIYIDKLNNSFAVNGFPKKPNSIYSGNLQLDNCIYVGSQVLYDSFSTSSSGTFQLLGAYDYQLIQGVFTALEVPDGYEMAYRLSAQVTTGNNNAVRVWLNNIATWGASTYSGNTYRILTASRIFKESEITLEPTLNYSTRQGINLKVSNASAYACNVYNITLHAYLVKSDQAIALIDEVGQYSNIEG